MSKSPQPFLVTRWKDAKTFLLTLNDSCGLPSRVCREWIRRSFQNLPDALVAYREPKSKAAATTGALALIAYLKNNQAAPAVKSDVTVGQWIELFTAPETSPRAARNMARNRPNSIDTIAGYESFTGFTSKTIPLPISRWTALTTRTRFFFWDALERSDSTRDAQWRERAPTRP
ncbi:MAG: hypothetical protein LBK00_06155 [Treponema sp.]|nr:hypothetical protein [Treponema sp.]